MAQIQKSVILKLRQEEATFNGGHGNFTVNLKKPVMMAEGDIVKVHTAVLDTSADGIVDVPDDGTGVGGIQCHLDVALYNTFYERRLNEAGEPFIKKYPYPDAASQTPTNERMVCCIGKGLPANTYRVNFFNIYPSGGGLDKYGDCTLTFQFTSPLSGQIETRQKYFKGGHQISHLRGIALPIGWNVIGNNGLSDFKCINTHDYLKEHKIDFKEWRNSDVQYGPAPLPPGTINLEPYQQRMSFVIKEGRYTPGEISNIITDEISMLNQEKSAPTTNNPANNEFPVINPLLTTIRQINHISSSLPGQPFSTWFCPMRIENAPVVPIDYAIQYPLSAVEAPQTQPFDIFVGAEQASMNFDPILKKLNFDILHFPLYVGWTGGATNDAKPGIAFTTTGSPITTYGGAMFTAMYPEHFWSKQLGFSNVVIDWQTQETAFNTGGTNGGNNEDIYPVVVTPVVGENITNVFDGLDTIVPKNNNFMNPGTTTAVVNTNTRPILSKREFDVALNDEGYFLIEIGFKFPQSMVGGMNTNNSNGTMNNIQAIIGKYFTSDNNFVQDQGTGSITYEHRGEPQLLTDLQIRILNPDGSEPTQQDLGVKNSIFLEVVKTLQLQSPQ